MINYKTETQEVKVPESKECDRCGTKRLCYRNLDGDIETFGVEWGYGSDTDGEYWEFDLCETCIKETLKTMNIKYRVYERGIDEIR